MINVHVTMPSVPWSTVPGARSRGYNKKTKVEAEKVLESLVRQLKKLEMWGCEVGMRGEGLQAYTEVEKEERCSPQGKF